MGLWLASLVAAFLLPQEAAPEDEKALQQKMDDLAKTVQRLSEQLAEVEAHKEKLAQENAALTSEIEGLRTASLEAAREIMLLRQALREASGAASNGRPHQGDAAGQEQAGGPKDGPTDVLRAKVWAVNAEYGFVIINKGEPDGVKPGFRFDIMRRMEVKSNGTSDWRWERLGVAEFDKYLGPSKGQSKLKVVEGKAQDMKYEDEAVAQRKVETPPADPSKTQTPTPIQTADGKKWAITGRVGEAYMINYGTQDGAKQSDRVFVYRGGRVRAHLRLDVVERDYAIGKLIDKTQNGEFGIGDEIQLKEPKHTIVGNVKWNDDKHGILIEAGLKEGVKPGMKFEVRRQGRKIGLVQVKRVDKLTSEVEPIGELKREEIYVEDFVESVD